MESAPVVSQGGGESDWLGEKHMRSVKIWTRIAVVFAAMGILVAEVVMMVIGTGTVAMGNEGAAAKTGAGEKKTAMELIALAEANDAGLKDAIAATFDAKELMDGTAYEGHGADFFFAVKASSLPLLIIDDETTARQMIQIPGSDIWYAVEKIEPVGRLHAFHYRIASERIGGRLDLPAYGPLSYLQPGVPTGTLTGPITHASKIYDGMKSKYWIYAPAEYDSKTAAALMVFQDGEWYIDRDGNIPILDAIDNLIAQKKIPVMICVFIQPGDISDAPGTPTYNFVKAHSEKWGRTMADAMRSTEYDTVSDRYARFFRDEVLKDVEAKYNIRKDAYSRAITGLSSGGICAFNAAWQMPDQFSRVISWIGSFEGIQWKEDPKVADGGQDYPDKILREPHRNIRVWIQDGANDLETEKYGSWPMANIRMANALKMKGYDFHFSFGKGTHNPGQGAAEFPEEMMWLWRDYDPAKTEQTYEMDGTEKAKPVFRVAIVNREAE
jgi:enterochelin esterase-like enzyme